MLLTAALGVAEPVSYCQQTIAGVSLHIVTADLNDPRVVVSPAMARRGIGRAESFLSFMSRLQPAAAINGTFFSKTSLRPVGDIVDGGRLLYFGGMGTAVAFAADGVDVIRLPHSRRVDWSEYRSALAAGPLLVWDGFAKPMPGGEGFGDPHVFARAATRSAVGVTADNKLLLVTTVTGTSLGRLAAAMRELGATYAVNLDGGSSSALWCDGHLVKSPGRDLTNVLCIYLRPPRTGRSDLRAPRGIDWRSGNRRALLSLRRNGLLVTAQSVPSTEPGRSLLLKSNHPLRGLEVRVRLDGRLIGTATKLPAEFRLEPGDTSTPEHKLWLGLVDARGKLLTSAGTILAE